MRIPIYQIDAFTDRLFSGNAAAVCPLEEWLQEEILQAIAAENNLSETAFLVPTGEIYELRWFTPTMEVDLCGHATLAGAFVLWEFEGETRKRLQFETRSGLVAATKSRDWITLHFPVRRARPVEAPRLLLDGIGENPVESLSWQAADGSGNYLIVLSSEDGVRKLKPDLASLGRLGPMGVIVTAAGEEVDFVSRYFAPAFGVPEDPATGSTHCTLVPFWADRLKKTKLRARQVSRRGGEFACELAGTEMLLSGRAVCYLRGEIELP